MRKTIAILLSIMLCAGLCACVSSGSTPAPSASASQPESAAPAENAAPEASASPEAPAKSESAAPASAEPETPAVSEEPNETFSLDGEWKQTNINDPSSYHVATIKDGTIEILWASDEDDVKMLYWAGSFESPTKDEATTITSQADHEQNDSALLASSDDTKDFEYKNGVLSYEFTAMGVTMTVKMERDA